jgi:hypothetical protein
LRTYATASAQTTANVKVPIALVGENGPSAGSFGFNTDILATNPINLSVVFGVLIFFGKGPG